MREENRFFCEVTDREGKNYPRGRNPLEVHKIAKRGHQTQYLKTPRNVKGKNTLQI